VVQELVLRVIYLSHVCGGFVKASADADEDKGKAKQGSDEACDAMLIWQWISLQFRIASKYQISQKDQNH
jgi:hypothetical protein